VVTDYCVILLIMHTCKKFVHKLCLINKLKKKLGLHYAEVMSTLQDKDAMMVIQITLFSTGRTSSFVLKILLWLLAYL
jgi:hypothetical protein